MFEDRIEAKWIDTFEKAFELCKVTKGEEIAILSETQSRSLNVNLAELALIRMGARPFHVVVPTPRQEAPVLIRSSGASNSVQQLGPVVKALAASAMVVDLTVDGILHAPELMADPREDGTNSGVFVILALDRGLVIIGGTHYAGEIKKAIFTIMNHILPAKDLLPMHCSANTDYKNSALFFGLSGTGKTTLSADPGRALIGDDEHGWSDDGVFNFEGGCYAKLIGLSKEDEPAIFATTRMPGSVLENVILDANGVPNFEDGTLTQNTRGSYPIESIENRTPDSMAGHPKDVVFLTCDAFGVLPPLSRLTPEQAAYHFISGYTAKVAGTEIGITEPQATFSTCFGAPFMPRHPSIYADLLSRKIREHNANCWLINTGWVAGGYGESSRIRIKWTRSLLNAALDGSLDDVIFVEDERFGFQIPTSCEGVPDEILQPRQTWPDKKRFDNVANLLAQMFIENFEQYSDGCSEEVLSASPKVLD